MSLFKNNSLGTKLAIQIALVIILAMIVLGVFEVYYRLHEFTLILEAKEYRTEQQLALILNRLLYDVDTVQMENVVSSYLTDPDLLAIKILSTDRVVMYQGKNPVSETPAQILDLTEAQVDFTRLPYVVLRQHELAYEGSSLGNFECVFSHQFIQQQMRETITRLSAAFLVVVLIESVVLLALVRVNVANPLLHLGQAARLIAEGDVHIHLQQTASQDEIALLSKMFETMIDYLQHMAGVATAMAAGNLSHTLEPRSKNDVLGGAFCKMAAYLNEMAAVATAIAEGDLTIDVPVHLDTDVFRRAMATMTKGLATLIQQIRTSAQQTAATGATIVALADQDTALAQRVQISVEETVVTMGTMEASVAQVAQDMNVLATAVETTLSSVSEVASSVAVIASNTTDLDQRTQQTITDLVSAIHTLEHVTKQTNSSKKLSQETIQDALEGERVVADLRESMDQIEHTNLQAIATITRFAEKTQEINLILDVIHDITGQSALLALNASIIASQAGVHGKGFSVIAEEMRNLANEVSASTKNIGAIAQSVQQETNTVTQMIHAGTASITQGAKRTQQAEERLQKIISSAQRVSAMVTETAEALQGQMTISHEVINAMDQVHTMMSEITRATNEQNITTKQIQTAIAAISNLASQTQEAMNQQLEGVHRVLEATDKVSALTEQNLSSSQRINQVATVDLTEQAALLLKVVDRFKLDGQMTPTPPPTRRTREK